jgi:hypothetical protein
LPAPSLERMCWRPREFSCENSVAYLVRSLRTNARIPLSHDWHVQPSCQRPNRLPPERRAFDQPEPQLVRIRPSSKPYKHTVRRKSRQPTHPTEFPRDFHNGKAWTGDFTCQRAISSTQQYVSSAQPTPNFGAAEYGRHKIEKRSYFWRSLL